MVSNSVQQCLLAWKVNNMLIHVEVCILSIKKWRFFLFFLISRTPYNGCLLFPSSQPSSWYLIFQIACTWPVRKNIPVNHVHCVWAICKHRKWSKFYCFVCFELGSCTVSSRSRCREGVNFWEPICRCNKKLMEWPWNSGVLWQTTGVSIIRFN